MLTEALEFPTSGEHGTSALFVGSALLVATGVFTLFGLLLFPFLGVAIVARIVVRGYYVRVLRTAARDRDPSAPAFESFASLLEEGFVAAVIAVIYALPAIVLFLVAIGGNLLTVIRDPTAVAIAQTFGGLGALFGLLYLLAMTYVLPGAVANYAHAESFEAAFRLRTILDGVVSEDYAVAWLLTVVLQALLFPVIFLLKLLLVGFVLQFVVGVAVRFLLGRAYAEAAGLDRSEVPSPGITPDASRGSTGDWSDSVQPDSWSTSGEAPSKDTDPSDAPGGGSDGRGDLSEGEHDGPNGGDDTGGGSGDPMAEDGRR